MGLVDIHNELSSADEILEKQAEEEFMKLAEEDAAGRIMARGFMDELNKVAAGNGFSGQEEYDARRANIEQFGQAPPSKVNMSKSTTGAARRGSSFRPGVTKRRSFSPKLSGNLPAQNVKRMNLAKPKGIKVPMGKPGSPYAPPNKPY